MRNGYARAGFAPGVVLALAACGGSVRHVDGTGGSGGAPATSTGGAGGTATAGTNATGATGGMDSQPDLGELGDPCTTASECDSTLTCALDACREGCRTDADCPRGSLCSGAAPPYGCSLPEELACESDADCPAPLTCGPDNRCRVACEVSDDCPRNDHECRTHVCVSHDDPDPRWFECDDGETVCENYVTGMLCGEEFPASCFRRMGCRLNGMDWGLIETCDAGFCVYVGDAEGRFSSMCM